MMGLPVSFTGMPRTRPSVTSMAMVRTTLSPRCWATSTTRLSFFVINGRVGNQQRRVNVRQIPLGKLHIDNRPHNLRDLTDILYSFKNLLYAISR